MSGAIRGLLAALLVIISQYSVRSGPLDEWTWQNPLPTGRSLYSVTYANHLFVAVGEGGTIVTSTNALSWSLVPTSAPDQLNRVIFADDMFVAVGRNGAILRSADGMTWSRTETGMSLTSIAYGNGLFFTVSEDGTPMTSLDATHWTYGTNRLAVASGYSYHVEFGNGTFVAAGMDGNTSHIYSSTDGLEWTLRRTSTTAFIAGCLFADGKFVVAGNGYPSLTIFTSTDGIDWQTKSIAGPAIFLGLSYANGLFLVGDQIPGPGRVWTSPDGVKWTPHRPQFYACPGDFAYGQGLYVSVGWSCMGPVANFDSIATSPDAVTWTSRVDGPAAELSALAFGNGLFAAAGVGYKTNDTQQSFATILTSTNGRAPWSQHFLKTNQILSAITHGNGTFVAVGYPSPEVNEADVVYTSSDGAEWTQRSTGGGNLLRSVTYGNGRFIAVGGRDEPNDQEGRIVWSRDGMTWTNVEQGLKQPLFKVAFGNDLFVAVGGRGRVLTSVDGAHWTQRESGATDTLRSLVFGNGWFLTTSYGPPFLRSRDGVDWEKTCFPGGFRRWWEGPPGPVAYGNGVFLWVNGGAWSSLDGETWTGSLPTNNWSSPLSFADVTYGNGTFVGVGWNGNILQSGTIEPTVALMAPSSPAIEGSATSAVFEVIRAGNVDQELTVNLSISGTAQAGVDYATIDNSIVFPAGVRSVPVPVRALPDNKVEGIETVAVTIVPGQGYTIGEPQTVAARLVDDLDPLATWTSQKPFPNTPGLISIAYGNERFVGVGPLGAVATSLDGSTWTARQSGTSESLGSVAFGNSAFVAVGAPAVILQSYDGERWTRVFARTNQALLQVNFGGGKFVAVGTEGLILTSLDGLNWVQPTNSARSTLQSVTFGNGLYVVSGDEDLLTSSNAINWTRQDRGFNQVAYGNGLFVGLMSDLFTSTDGQTWSAGCNPLVRGNFSDLRFGHSVFVALDNAGSVLESLDGAHWERHDLNATDPPYSLSYGNGVFFAFDSSGTIYQSGLVAPPELRPRLLGAERSATGAFYVRVFPRLSALPAIEASADLVKWDVLPSEPSFVGEGIEFRDPDRLNAPRRYYRLRWPSE